jgi:hypothetical protein
MLNSGKKQKNKYPNSRVVRKKNSRRKKNHSFPRFYIRLYDKNSESYYFFSSTKIRIFFLQHWESEYFFLEKKHNPPPHQVKWSFPKISIEKSNNIEEYY